MNKSTKTFLNSTILTTILATSILSLSACKDEEQNVQKEESVSSSKHMEYREPEIVRPLNVRTLSGSYLIAQHAQFSNDWKVASKYMNKFLSEDYSIKADAKNDYKKRAMILNLGAGDIGSAVYYAKNFNKEKQNALSLVLQSIPLIKSGEYSEALLKINDIPAGGMADLIKPIIQNWLMFSVNDVPKLNDNISSQELYHLILAADYYSNVDFLKSVASDRVVKSGLGAQIIINIADIFARHDLTGRALSVYQGLDFDKGQNIDIDVKITTIKNGGEIDIGDLFASVNGSKEGISIALLSIGTAMLQEGSMDSVLVFANLSRALNSNLYDANILLGYVAIEYEKYDEAIEYFESAVRSDLKNYVEIQRLIANVQEEAGMFEDAVSTLEGIASKEDSIEVRTQIGDISRNNDYYKDALKAYDKAISMIDDGDEEKYWNLFYSRGIAQERLGMWNKAEENLIKALKFEPNHPYILNYLGYSWADQGKNLDEALDMITQAVSLMPNDGYIVDSLGWVYFKLNKFDESVPPLERAVELMPEDPTLNDHLGDAYWKVGRKHEARFQWSRALNFAENDPESLSGSEVNETVGRIREKLEVGL